VEPQYREYTGELLRNLDHVPQPPSPEMQPQMSNSFSIARVQ
jgi:hypothetical protein